MAIYHLDAQIIGRTDGRSAIACAAYRSGEAITDERTGTVHQHGDPARVVATEILAPVGAPAWATDRAQLWNRVETTERRKDSQLAREFEAALPVELDLDRQLDLLRGWVAAELLPHGIVADICVHDERKPDEPANPHAHIMITMRGFTADGQGFGPKLRDMNWGGTIERWRASWADHANAALELAGSQARIDHRSNKARGLGPATIKEGPGARRRERTGRISSRMAFNRTVKAQRSLSASLGDTITAHLHRMAELARTLAEKAKRRKLAAQQARTADAATKAVAAPTASTPRRGVSGLAAGMIAKRGHTEERRLDPRTSPAPDVSGADDAYDAALFNSFRTRNDIGKG